MESSPYVPTNITPDSGLEGSSRNESNPCGLFTPTISVVTSRKRKIFDSSSSILLNTRQTSSVESADLSPWIEPTDILSSTMNESITKGVEKCKLDSFAANYYMERSDMDSTADTASFLRSMKEPSTPTKSSMKRFCNSNTIRSPILKLGSPEKNGILYPNRQTNLPRLCDSKRFSPAKKCLFIHRATTDPVTMFCVDRYIPKIIAKIFRFLSDEELYTCSEVSRGWKKALMEHKDLKKRLRIFIKNKTMNKENTFNSPFFNLNTSSCSNQMKQSTPIETTPTLYEVTKSLTENQHLEKCMSCNKPLAVVEKNISQCTYYRCGAIRCLRCNSISKTGPENFIDSCQQSMLLIEKPASKYSLLDSPKRSQNASSIPSFLLDDSTNTPHSMNSSGYMTDIDESHSRRHSTSFSKGKIDISQVLKSSNALNTSRTERNWELRNCVVPVIPSTKKTEEIIEPSSPPKVKHVACTKKSRKLLKRLNL